ncbi:hypothetical protein SAMN02927900_01287 [Rhizobium mongolense subsp. loessense]|uniref:Uncharacterized protein n=1 Tax=Rhizobium mongolense subsp. loessense TaxID=158890 RepID=A0A1G4Q4C5_9HYPH|nr:YtxH domain-containing protein [Rhizobium mongolense]SCW38999.1 hypothetical protein SAMN02927900_01287 [Rhizobium mongolense subsp. loessense]
MPLDRSSPLFPAQAETVGISDYDTPEPSFLEKLTAAYRQDNSIVSGFAQAGVNIAAGNKQEIDPTYNPYEDPDLKEYVDRDPDRWINTFSKPAANAMRAQIDMEDADKQTQAASGWTGVALRFAAGFTDWPTLIPGGALVAEARGGFSAVRSAASVGLAAGMGAAAQEASLHATQETRVLEESAYTVGGSVLLGGIIGAAAAKFFSPGEWTQVGKKLELDLDDTSLDIGDITNTAVQRAQSTGAAAVDEIDISDLAVGGGKAADLVTRATAAARINPGVQTMLSPSVKVREVYNKLVDNPIYTRMNMEGRSLGADVENSVKLYERGAVGDWLGSARKLYREARKNGFQGTLADFNQAVARAGRRGDSDVNGNPFVTQAAQEARSKIFNPLLERAKALALLPDDVKTTTAASYVTRFWNRQRLIGEENRFREIARRYFNEEMDKALIRQEERKLGNKIVDTLYVDDRLDRAFQRLNSIESRLNERAVARSRKNAAIDKNVSTRMDLVRQRPPREVLDVIKTAKDDDTLMPAIKESKKAERALNRKPTYAEKYPVLSVFRQWGGVRVGSPLDSEMRAMGVTPTSHPGLFHKTKGMGAADTIVWAEHPVLRDNMHEGANGYADPGDLLEAIRREVGGDPIRTVADAEKLSTAEALTDNVSDWLRSVGLSENASVKEIRDLLQKTTGRERQLGEVDERIARMQQELREFDEATEGIRNERIISDAEARKVADELRDLEEQINASADLARESPAIGRMVDYAKTRRDFGAARYEQAKVANRLEALRLLETEGRLTPAMKADMDNLVTQAKDIEKRIARATEKSDKLKPTLPKQKQDIPDFISDEDRDDYIEEIVGSVFNNLTGKGAGDVPEWLVPVTRGPLKERTFNIKDELVEDFLENDIEVVLRRYARTMGAEVELAQRFGRPDMKEQFDEITRDYEALRSQAKTPAEREKLSRDETRDVKNLAAFRDMIRGTYKAADESSDWSKITRAALTWNYLRLMGGVALTSMTDAASILGKFGARQIMTDALPALVSGTKAAQIARQDARDLGVVTERVLQSRLANLAELQDPYQYGSKFERFLSNTSNIFTKATGLGYWNDTLRTIVAVMSQNRMLKNALDWTAADKSERAYMAMLGIDEDMAHRIGGQFKRYGVEEDGIYGANASAWDDDLARRAWAAALNKDADRVVIMKGVADNPLWMKSNVGKLLFQFKSFSLASHQRVLIAGLQERPHRLAEQLVFATGLGMLISYLKYVERGDVEEANKLLENPGLWVANGVDRSGILSIPFEFSNTIEKVGLPGMMSGAQTIAGDQDKGGASRYASRGTFGALAGPTIGAFEDLTQIVSQIAGGDLKKSGANAIIRQIPGATLPGIRSAVHIGLKPALTDAVDDAR